MFTQLKNSKKQNILKYFIPLVFVFYFSVVGSSNIFLNDTFLIPFYSLHKLSENLFFETTFAPLGYFSFYLIYIINLIRPDNFFIDIYQLYIFLTLFFFYIFLNYIIDYSKKINLIIICLFIFSIYSEKSYPFYSSTAFILFAIIIINYLPNLFFIKNRINNKYFFVFTVLIIFFTRQDLAILLIIIFFVYGFFYEKHFLYLSLISLFFIISSVFLLVFFTNSYEYINLFFNANVIRIGVYDIFYEFKKLILSPHFIMLSYLFVKNLFYFSISNTKKIDLYFILINISFLLIDFQTGTREIYFISGVFNTIYFLNYFSKTIIIFIILILNSSLIQQSLNHVALNILKFDYLDYSNTNIPKFKLANDYELPIIYIENLYMKNNKIINISNTRFLDNIYKNYNFTLLPIWIDDNVTFYKKDIKNVVESIFDFNPDYIILQDTSNSKKMDCKYFHTYDLLSHCTTSNYFNLIKKFESQYIIEKSYEMNSDNNIYILRKS